MGVFDPLNPMQNITPKYTEEQLEQIVTWFDENAKPLLVIGDAEAKTNVVKIEQLEAFFIILFKEQKNFHRRSFHYPSYGELMTVVEHLKMESFRLLTKEQIIYIFNKFIVEPDIKHEIKLAFEIFDPEMQNFIEIEVLKENLITLGDVFNTEECIEFLRDANMNGDGNILYKQFIESMFQLAPELYNLETEFFYENPDHDPSVPPMPPEPEPEPVPELPPQPPPPPPPPPAKDAGKGKDKKGKK